MADQIALTPPITNPAIQAVDALIGRVARAVGGSEDLEARNYALDCLDRAADMINGSGLYLFRLKEQEYPDTDLGGAFTADQETLTLPTDWGWPERSVFVYDDQDKIVKYVYWVNWPDFRANQKDIVAGSEGQSGTPDIIAIKNENENTAYLYPHIDITKVSKIKIAYYARVIRPSEATGGALYSPPETIEALSAGGLAFMMQYRYQERPQVWTPYMKEFEKSVTRAKQAAGRREGSQIFFARPLVENTPLPHRGLIVEQPDP